ncbi:MAG: response regulator, partial [bacterium]
MADKVLIVDDDPAIQKMLEKVMNSNHLEADIASDGRQALDMIRRGHYQVILLDINMGDIDGFEVIKKTRSEGNVTPIIIISGRNEDYDALYGLSVGADDYITKPFR